MAWFEDATNIAFLAFALFFALLWYLKVPR